MISCIAKWSMLAAIVFTKRIDVDEIYDRALAAYYKVGTIKDILHLWKIFDTNEQWWLPIRPETWLPIRPDTWLSIRPHILQFGYANDCL